MRNISSGIKSRVIQEKEKVKFSKINFYWDKILNNFFKKV
jgi:hypothetical protein